MKRPVAYRHLVRLHELATSHSIVNVVHERGLLEGPEVEEAVAEGKAAAEEVAALARERGWTLPETRPYAWGLMSGESEVIPRVLRVLSRDVFELEEIARTTDDDDVGSLATHVATERRALERSLARIYPRFAVPGAK